MKRKLDKNKIYAFIGRAVVYSSAYVGIILFGFWAFCQNTIYQKEGTNEKDNTNNIMLIFQRKEMRNMLEKWQKMINNIKQEDEKQKEIIHIQEMFIMQDYAKDLLFNSTTERQEESSRSFLERINRELKILYIPTPIENVQ